MIRLRLIAVAALALVLVLPGSVLAATVDVGGTVTGADGQPAAGVEVLVLVQGTDTIVPATTDANGAWGVQLDVEPGAVLEISATGPTVRSEPDAEGCVTTTTPTARVTVTVTAEPLGAIDLPLDGAITGRVCSATSTPDPGVTPPSTDTIGGPGSGAVGPAIALLLGGLALTCGLALVVADRGRAERR